MYAVCNNHFQTYIIFSYSTVYPQFDCNLIQPGHALKPLIEHWFLKQVTIVFDVDDVFAHLLIGFDDIVTLCSQLGVCMCVCVRVRVFVTPTL